MSSGTVYWFNEQYGYGFIQPDDGGKDVFVHISAVQRSGLQGLRDAQRVSYEMQEDRRTGKRQPPSHPAPQPATDPRKPIKFILDFKHITDSDGAPSRT